MNMSLCCQMEISAGRTPVNTAAPVEMGSAVTPARVRKRTAAATVKPVNIMIYTSDVIEH